VSHSSDKTLLARLGFADPDKGRSEHDRACQYLALPEQRAKVLDLVVGRLLAERDINERVYTALRTGHIGRFALKHANSILEEPISKGSGAYQTTIGFVDVVYEFMYTRQFVGQENTERISREEPERAGLLNIEVKIAKVSVGEVLRQVGLYKEYENWLRHAKLARQLGIYNERDYYRKDGWRANWVLATAYDISEADRITLANAGIVPVRLGAGFQEFMRQCDAAPSSASIEEM
jgi:hypothetical protein